MHSLPLTRIILVSASLFLIQVLGSAWGPLGAPPLVLIACVWFGWSGGPRQGAAAGVIAGLFEDLFSAGLFGSGVIAGVLLGVWAGVVRQWLWREGRNTYIVLALATVMIKNLFDGLIFIVGGGGWSGLGILPSTILFQGAIAAVFAWTAYPFFRRMGTGMDSL